MGVIGRWTSGGDIGLALLRTFVDSFLFDQYADPLDALNGDQLRPLSAILEIPKEPVRTFCANYLFVSMQMHVFGQVEHGGLPGVYLQPICKTMEQTLRDFHEVLCGPPSSR